jgi:hypothetical protein
MKMSAQNLLRPGLSNFELKQRVALVESGASFHIRHATLAVTPAGQQKLGPFFDPANIRLSQIGTLADLANAYATWRRTAPESERARLRLRAGKGCIPLGANEVQLLERRVLLTLAPSLDLGQVDIELTDAGVKRFAGLCSVLCVAPAALTTLADLVRLPEDVAQRGMANLGFTVQP